MNIFNNRRAALLSALLVAGVIAIGVSSKAHAQEAQDTQTWKLPESERRMTPIYKSAGEVWEKTKEKTAAAREKAHQGWDFTKDKFNNLFVAKAAPRPVVEPYQPPLPALCPSKDWRKLEELGYWLKHSPSEQLPYSIALDAAKKNCGTNAEAFKANLQAIEKFSDKYFSDTDIASRAFNAIGNLTDAYGTTSASAAN